MHQKGDGDRLQVHEQCDNRHKTQSSSKNVARTVPPSTSPMQVKWNKTSTISSCGQPIVKGTGANSDKSLRLLSPPSWIEWYENKGGISRGHG